MIGAFFESMNFETPVMLAFIAGVSLLGSRLWNPHRLALSLTWISGRKRCAVAVPALVQRHRYALIHWSNAWGFRHVSDFGALDQNDSEGTQSVKQAIWGL